jgi:hypothetical protein
MIASALITIVMLSTIPKTEACRKVDPITIDPTILGQWFAFGDDLGPFNVVGPEVHTGLVIQPHQAVRVMATGVVNFGGFLGFIGTPILGAEGDDCPTPPDYPAPSLRKNSLIVKIAGDWYQGETGTFIVPRHTGEVILAANDNVLGDNSGAWKVFIRPASDQILAAEYYIAQLPLSTKIKSVIDDNNKPVSPTTESRKLKITFESEPSQKVDYHYCELKLDNTVVSIIPYCKNPVTIDSLEAGAYTFTVKAHDKYFNYPFDPPPYYTLPEYGSPDQIDWIIPEPDTMIFSAVDGNGKSLLPTQPTETHFPCISNPCISDSSSLMTLAPPVTTTTSKFVIGFDKSYTNQAKGFECLFDGNSWVPCTSPWTYASTFPILPPGKHTFKVRMIDSEGNRDPSPASVSWYKS